MSKIRIKPPIGTFTVEYTEGIDVYECFKTQKRKYLVPCDFHIKLIYSIWDWKCKFLSLISTTSRRYQVIKDIYPFMHQIFTYK